jgi:hypothetical protein
MHSTPTLLIGRFTAAHVVVTAILGLSMLIGGYCEYVTLELLFEMPELLRIHATSSSSLHFYNAIVAFFVVIYPPIILYGLLNVCSLPDADSDEGGRLFRLKPDKCSD